MTLGIERAKSYLTSLVDEYGLQKLLERLQPRTDVQPMHVPLRDEVSLEAVQSRWELLAVDEESRSQLLDDWSLAHLESYQRNIEHLIGTVKVPVGLAGPLRVNGLFAQGDYYVPLATSEASLVASYSRGACLITESGGASVALLSEGVSRAPMLAFASIADLGQFVDWALSHLQEIAAAANATTGHGKLQDIELSIEGTKVYFLFIYTTGDASGQNMVTIATYAALQWIMENSPIRPKKSYLESNFSGDKKASSLSFQRVRGKKVVAEATLPANLVRSRLHADPAELVEYVRIGHPGCRHVRRVGNAGAFRKRASRTFPGLRTGRRLCFGGLCWHY